MGVKIKKLPSVKKLKDKAWPLFSKYIRLRDCLETTGDTTIGVCFTCGRTYEFKKLQAGHFIPGRHGMNLFDPRGCHAQCYSCNVMLKGNPIKYWTHMEQKYGRELIDELIAQDQEVKIFTIEELENLIIKLKVDIDKLAQLD